MAHNEATQSIMTDLDAAQTNLNANPDNRILLNKFIKAAQQTASELKSRYSEFWDEPQVAQQAVQVAKVEDDDE